MLSKNSFSLTFYEFENFTIAFIKTVQLQCFEFFWFVLLAVAKFESTLFVCGRTCKSALMSCCLLIGLLFTCCDVENTLPLSASVWSYFFFVQQFFINSAATVFPNIFNTFVSGLKIKSTLFVCGLFSSC